MANVVLESWLGDGSKFSASYQMFNVISFIFPQPSYIIGHSKLDNFRYNDYLVISSFTLLPYDVVAVAQLAEDRKVSG